jgi:hypothetical protein
MAKTATRPALQKFRSSRDVEKTLLYNVETGSFNPPSAENFRVFQEKSAARFPLFQAFYPSYLKNVFPAVALRL